MRNKPIRVTFCDKESEDTLYKNIMEECELIGPCRWMKRAAKEKIERDRRERENNTNQSTQASNSIISSLDDLFK